MSRYIDYEPCSICEKYMVDVKCDFDECPVYRMKEENRRLRKKVQELKSDLKHEQSWESFPDYGHEMGQN